MVMKSASLSSRIGAWVQRIGVVEAGRVAGRGPVRSVKP